MNGSIFFNIFPNFGKIGWFCSKFGPKWANWFVNGSLFLEKLVFVWVYFQNSQWHVPTKTKLEYPPSKIIFKHCIPIWRYKQFGIPFFPNFLCNDVVTSVQINLLSICYHVIWSDHIFPHPEKKKVLLYKNTKDKLEIQIPLTVYRTIPLGLLPRLSALAFDLWVSAVLMSFAHLSPPADSLAPSALDTRTSRLWLTTLQALKCGFWRVPIFKAILKGQLRVPRPLLVKE